MSAWLPVMAGWYVGKGKCLRSHWYFTRCWQAQEHSELLQKWSISSTISLFSRVTENRDVTVRQLLSSSWYHWCVPENGTSKYSSVAREAVGRAILPQNTLKGSDKQRSLQWASYLIWIIEIIQSHKSDEGKYQTAQTFLSADISQYRFSS